ncbi:MAG: DUF5658 family protein [Planctomycetales bacterium]
MKESIHHGRSASGGVLQFFLHQRLPLEREMLLFCLASLLDFLLTRQLLTDEGSHYLFMESNPVARYFLMGWGLRGLIYFKAVTVAFVIVICQIIARERLDVARRLLRFALLAAMAVVAYSAVLMLRHT